MRWYTEKTFVGSLADRELLVSSSWYFLLHRCYSSSLYQAPTTMLGTKQARQNASRKQKAQSHENNSRSLMNEWTLHEKETTFHRGNGYSWRRGLHGPKSSVGSIASLCKSDQEGAKNEYLKLTLLPPLLQSPADASVDLAQLEVRGQGSITEAGKSS